MIHTLYYLICIIWQFEFYFIVKTLSTKCASSHCKYDTSSTCIWTMTKEMAPELVTNNYIAWSKISSSVWISSLNSLTIQQFMTDYFESFRLRHSIFNKGFFGKYNSHMELMHFFEYFFTKMSSETKPTVRKITKRHLAAIVIFGWYHTKENYLTLK